MENTQNTKKILFILRGVSGCGKSTAGEALVGKENTVTADDYFYMIGKGTYAFDVTKLGNAHAYCNRRLKELLSKGVPKVCVANTTTKTTYVNGFIKLAKEYGYMPIVMTVENRHGGVSLHDVPEYKLEQQEAELRNSIVLR